MQHYGKMQRVARTILYDEQAGEDVISDIFESLLRGRTALSAGTADWEDGAAERYLLTSVRNRCLKLLRRAPGQSLSSTVQADWLAVMASADAADADDELLADIMSFVASHLSEQFEVGVVDAARHLQVGDGVHLSTKLLCQFTWCGVFYDQLFVVLSVCKRHSEQSAYGK